MDNTSKINNLNVYLPLRNQAAKTTTALIGILIFGTVQWIRSDQPGRLGLVDYWVFSLQTIPNDYKLLVIVSSLSLLLMLIFTFAALIDRSKINPFLLGVLDIIPTFGNLLILSFFFYLIFFRGFWSLSEFKNGFSFIPILKVIFFSGLGIYGYKGFSHFYQLKRLLKRNNMTDFVDYVVKYKLYEI